MSNPNRQLSDQLVVRIDPELKKRLEELSRQNGRTLGQTVRLFLRKSVDG